MTNDQSENKAPRPAAEREPAVRSFFREASTLRNTLLVLLLALASLYTLYFARVILIPVAVAVLLHFVLKPLHIGLVRIKIPSLLAAAVVLGLLVGGIVYGTIHLAGPAQGWMERLPVTLTEMEHKLRTVFAAVEEVKDVAEKVDRITALDGGKAEALEVEMADSLAEESVWQQAGSFLVGASVVVMLLFFTLAFSDELQERLAYGHEHSAVLFDQVRRHVSIYLITITLINAGLGASVALGMHLIDMPNPVLWGVMAAALNYIPYLGAIVGAVIMLLAAIVTFDEPGRYLLAPIIYYGLTVLEGVFVTPIILGRRFRINPIFIVLALLLWGWIWGVAGALLAVPLLMAFHIICEDIPKLAWISRLISR